MRGAMVGMMFTRIRRQGGLGFRSYILGGAFRTGAHAQRDGSAGGVGCFAVMSDCRSSTAAEALAWALPVYVPWVPKEAPWTLALLKHLRHVRSYRLDRFDGKHLEYWLGIAGQDAEDAWILEHERGLCLRRLYIMEHIHPTLRSWVTNKTSPVDITKKGSRFDIRFGNLFLGLGSLPCRARAGKQQNQPKH